MIDKNAPIRRDPIGTIIAIMALVLLWAMIVSGGIGTWLGFKNVIGGMR